MKAILKTLLLDALSRMGLRVLNHEVCIEDTSHLSFGDFTSNIALLLAKTTEQKAPELAERIVSHFPAHAFLKKAYAAKNGFINFSVYPQAFKTLIETVLDEKNPHRFYPSLDNVKQKKIHIEFVSSNPTGPLHVGHGRGAAWGDVLANVLEAVGAEVHREYYINDAGRQMDILTVSVYWRYLIEAGEPVPETLSSNCYQGDYIKSWIAQPLFERLQKKYVHSSLAKIFCDYALSVEDEKDDAEKYLDGLILGLKKTLGQNVYQEIFDLSLETILSSIQKTLEHFGVVYDRWFSEKKDILDHHQIETTLDLLREKNYLYQKDGATWFQSTLFGDDKDRVVIRENGQYTYFASDAAYHHYKFQHYDEIINVLGSDHHGYIPRLKAIIQALGYDVKRFHTPVVQFVTLFRGKEKLPMSTRQGEFVTLDDLQQDIGKDAARFFYTLRKADQPMDFDLALAKSTSQENPVYYIQYAHARIASTLR